MKTKLGMPHSNMQYSLMQYSLMQYSLVNKTLKEKEKWCHYFCRSTSYVRGTSHTIAFLVPVFFVVEPSCQMSSIRLILSCRKKKAKKGLLSRP